MNNSLSPRATMLLGLFSGPVANGPELKERVRKISKGRLVLVQGSMYTTAQLFQSEKLLTATPDRWELTAAGKKEAVSVFETIQSLMTAKPGKPAASEGKKSGKAKAKRAGGKKAKPSGKARGGKSKKARKTGKSKAAPVAHVSQGPSPVAA